MSTVEQQTEQRISLKQRKAYLATIPWVRMLKKPTTCTGWHNKSFGKKPCKNQAWYSFKHHQSYKRHGHPVCDHRAEIGHYCWSHLISRGFYDGMCEEARFDKWVKKNPPPWETGDEYINVGYSIAG